MRPRLERLAQLGGVTEILAVECRTSCCQIEHDSDSIIEEELQTSSGLPFGDGGALFSQGRVVICFLPGEPYPPPTWADRLDERIILDPVFRDTEKRCRGVAGTPGTVGVAVAIASSGAFELQLDGDMQGTTAAGCVEDYLYDHLRFAAAGERSNLDVHLKLEGP